MSWRIASTDALRCAFFFNAFSRSFSLSACHLKLQTIGLQRLSPHIRWNLLLKLHMGHCHFLSVLRLLLLCKSLWGLFVHLLDILRGLQSLLAVSGFFGILLLAETQSPHDTKCGLDLVELLLDGSGGQELALAALVLHQVEDGCPML